MTLIAVYNSEGCVGRCDAKCYEASSPDCDCVCGGMNHGGGQQKAIDNTRQMCESWIEEYTEKHNLNSVTWDVPVNQLALF
jgi:hypothetical protein